MADDLAAFGRKLDNIIDGFTSRVDEGTLHELGKAAKGDAQKALTGELGDMSMSNWRRGRPINLAVRYDLVGGGVEVGPSKRAAGPWKVLESGRRAGTSKGKRGRPARHFGASPPKGTWSAAVEIMQRETPRRVDEAFQKVLRRQFGG